MAGAPNSYKNKVNSFGEPWVICRSKSHFGRQYYFNTLTGDACWNLSIEEIKNARHWTKNLASEGNIEPREPTEPPTLESVMDNSMKLSSNNQNNTSPTTSNTQTSRNIQFTRHSMPVSPFIVPSCNNILSGAINSLVPFGVNSPLSVTAFNNNVWAVPPGQPIYLAPAVTSLMSQAQPPVTVTFNSQEPFLNVQNTPETQSESSQGVQIEQTHSHNISSSRRYDQRRSFLQNKQNTFRQKQNYQRELQKQLECYDLRNYLSNKNRKKNIDDNKVSENSLTNNKNCKNKDAHVYKLEEFTESGLVSQKEKDDDVDADCDWLEENIIVQGRQLKLNITNIKKLAKPNVDPECWFIVTDETILLNHLNFLNTLCNSDDLCQLMVPQQVMLQLREQAYSGLNNKITNRARRALAFIKQLLDSNYVVIGEGVNDSDRSKGGYLLDCCLTLSDQNYLVILLSNNEEIKLHKNGSKVPNFSVKEMKQFLTKSDSKTERVSESPAFIRKPIKITVSNELLQELVSDQLEESLCEKECVNESQESLTVPAMDQSEDCSPVRISSSPIEGEVFECATTETCILQKALPQSPQLLLEISRNLHNPHKDSATTESGPGDEACLNATSTTQPKKREIRLKRGARNTKPVDAVETSLDIKKFKWRKRRSTAKSSSGIRLSCSDNKSDDLDNIESKPHKTKDIEQYSPAKVQENKICTRPTSNNMTDEVFINENTELRSETSSVTMIRKVGTDIVIDKTSTSGIVSNTTSNVEDFNQSDPKDLENNTMFEVKDQNMEDHLLTRCDEWVSRFLQIMEEALTQVLRQDRRFLYDVVYKLHGGGPWTIKEATDCVKKKFKNSLDIVDAANKLEHVFVRVSDETGRIDKNLQPSQYMEMYSYGVGLVEQLHSVLSDCEDLGTATESLKKLLHDIQNPNVDCSHNEVFENSLHKVPQNNSQINDINARDITSTPQRIVEKSPTKRGSNRSPQNPYNLRSKSKRSSQENSPQSEPIQKNIIETEKTFFKTLNLKKNGTSIPNLSHDSSPFGTNQDAQMDSYNHSNKCDDEYKKEYNSNVQPVVIRKFTVYPEFEKRISNYRRETLDLDVLDYSNKFDEDLDCMGDDFYYDSELSKTTDEQDIDQKQINESMNIKETDVTRIEGQPKSLNVDSPSDVNDKINSVFYIILKEIKVSLLHIHEYCVAMSEELLYDIISRNRKMEIRDEAKKVKLLVENLFNSLNSAYCRDSYDRKNNIQTLLKSANINNLDHNQLHVYRDVIGKLLEHAKILKESIVFIIQTVNNKPAS